MNDQPVTKPAPIRLASIDAYRGLVMFLMLAEALHFCAVSTALPDSGCWRFLCQQQSHAEWVGCSLHDLIQPSFSFLVGTALAFSIANRRGRGQSLGAMTRHAAIRSVILIFLGMAILSVHPRHWFWQFDDTLSQIGLAYPFVFLLGFRPARDRWAAFAVILAGYWLFFALSQPPGPEFDYAAAGISPEWLQHHGLSGFDAHWQKNSNPAWAFDHWFLNLFPRHPPYSGPQNGLTTLNFIPLIGTMILGLQAGENLRSARDPWRKIRWSTAAGVIGLAAGWLLGRTGVCPVVKAIWTPSWVLFSGGWCFLLLTFFYLVCDVAERRAWVFPLVVIGMNSIVAYCLAHLHRGFAYNSLKRVVSPKVFNVFGEAYEPLVYGAVVLVGYWLFLFVLYRRKLFLRI